MSEEEIFQFCGHITKAASRLGLKARENKTEAGLFNYEFADLDTKVRIRGQESDKKHMALYNACITLVKYFDAKAA